MHAYAALDDRLLVLQAERRSHCAQTTAWEVSERLEGHECLAVDASPERPERAFAGTAMNGLRRTTDGGRDWHAVGDFDDRVTAVTVSPHDPDDVWVGTEPSAVYRSRDGGVTWDRREGLTDLPTSSRWSFPPRPETHHVRWLAVAPEDPETIYVAIEAGAFVRSTDGGETWLDHPEGAPIDTHTIAVHPDAPDRVYCAAGDGYAESPDGGESWQTPQAGLQHRYAWGLAVDPADPEGVVVSAASGPRSAHSLESAESYVYRREEGHWQRAMAGLPDPAGLVRPVLAAAGEKSFIAMTNHGAFRSLDGASSWTALPCECSFEGSIPQDLAVLPLGLRG